MEQETFIMESNAKIQVYKGMIQYILESTHYNLKNIADLINSSTKHICSIHCAAIMPDDFQSELQLIKLFQIIFESNRNRSRQIERNIKITME